MPTTQTLLPNGTRSGAGDFTVTGATTAPPPEDVLSDYALTRCEIEDFWTALT